MQWKSPSCKSPVTSGFDSRPDPVLTQFQDVAKRPGARPKTGSKVLFVSAEQVVRQAIASLEADRPLVIAELAMKFAMLVSRLMPMSVLRLLFRLSLRQN
jgi:short-subunit dehydrogenase